MPQKDFIFKRNLDSSTAKEINYIAENVLEDFDCFSLVHPNQMHISLLHQSMLKERKTPKQFNPYYSSFEANRTRFTRGKDNPGPWDDTEVDYAGTEMLKYALSIKTEAPEWLINERRTVMKISGIGKSYINFDSSKYQPHIAIAYFTGPIRDLVCIEEVEKELHAHYKDIGAIALKPLNFRNSEGSWLFLPEN